MLFNSLSKLKRTMVMAIIFLLFTGLTMFVVPVSYIPVLGKALGFYLLVLSILKILDFISSKKAMINYIGLTLGLLAGFFGILLYAIDGLFLTLLNRNRDAGSKELLVRLKEEIDAFAGDVPQFDDTTMLGFRYNGIDQGTEA